ncbi:MAG: SDR family NAD(P)-dependent oxidoreductase [Trebonia sp.]|jgi:NAD(P)-dependent dehydrogenase (short-subunit alcohol dehydrogenase family)
MNSFAEKVAIVTGGGSGMGRELVRQLAAEGCSVATCDLNVDSLAETRELATGQATGSAAISVHRCDVSDEAAMLRFRDAALAAHQADHVDLVFANAAIGGGGSFINDPREQWERVFAVNWWGVYHTARTFLPLLIASPEGVLVNTSSVNGIWASLGPAWPHTAYSTAKFAVKGFTESLIEDLRTNAPHVRAVLVMPGYIGTNIVGNSMRAFGVTDSAEIEKANAGWRDGAPTTAAEAATIILDGVRSGAWRILVGEDAKKLDEFVRTNPESTYDHAERTKYLLG